MKVDGQLYTHPDVVGYLELRSATLDRELLSSLARGFVDRCQSKNSFEFDKSDPGTAQRLFLTLATAERGALKIEGVDGSIETALSTPIFMLNEADALRMFYQVD